MKKSNIIVLLGALILMVPMFFAGSSAAAADNSATIMIHKKKYSTEQTPVQNIGKESLELKKVQGVGDVVYDVYDVTAVYQTLRSQEKDYTKIKEVLSTADLSDAAIVKTGKTDANGDLTFKALAKVKGSQDAAYVIKESAVNGAAAAAAVMVVTFPVYEMKGDTYTDQELSEIHLYPKSTMHVDGSLTVEKTGSAKGEALKDAKFTIAKEEAGVTKYINSAEPQAGLYTWTTDAAAAHRFATDEKGQLNITGLEYGTYTLTEVEAPTNAALIDSETVKNFTIDGQHKAVTVRIVNDTTAVEKTMPEFNGKAVEIGAPITYSIKTNLPKGLHDNSKYTTFVITDTHSKELTYNKDGKLSVNGKTIAAESYTVAETAEGFTVALSPVALAELPAGGQVEFNYTMHLNEQAQTNGSYFNNATVDNDLTHAETPTTDSKTPKITITVKTFGKSFVKQDLDTKKVLSGAEFVIKKGERYAIFNDGHTLTGWVEKATDATHLTSDEKGEFKVNGLGEQDYELVEVKAPTNYVLPKDSTTFTADDQKEALKIDNKHKGTLPSTGGTGIIAFVAIGLTLTTAGVIYFSRRRQVEA